MFWGIFCIKGKNISFIIVIMGFFMLWLRLVVMMLGCNEFDVVFVFLRCLVSWLVNRIFVSFDCLYVVNGVYLFFFDKLLNLMFFLGVCWWVVLESMIICFVLVFLICLIRWLIRIKWLRWFVMNWSFNLYFCFSFGSVIMFVL